MNTNEHATHRAEGNTNSSANSNRRYRRWCITLNNYTDTRHSEIKDYFEQHGYKYIIGKEGDEKTRHLQIYFESNNAIKFSTLKRAFPKAHIEKAKGNRIQNIKYCKKEGNFITNFEVNTYRYDEMTIRKLVSLLGLNLINYEQFDMLYNNQNELNSIYINARYHVYYTGR